MLLDTLSLLWAIARLALTAIATHFSHHGALRLARCTARCEARRLSGARTLLGCKLCNLAELLWTKALWRWLEPHPGLQGPRGDCGCSDK